MLVGGLTGLAAARASAQAVDPVRLADPLVGTAIYGGALNPGACLPYSMVKLGPDTTKPSTAGYNPGEPIIGFSHTHIGGTGGNAFAGQILVRPQTGPLDVSLLPSPKAGEIASPGYYAVTLTREGARAELTATGRAGVHRYTFQAGMPGRVLIDVAATLNNQSPEAPSSVCMGSSARFVSDRRIEGEASFVGGNANLAYTVHFVAVFDRTPTGRGAWVGTKARPDVAETKGGKGARAGLYAEFAGTPSGRVGLRIGISYVSLVNARRNLAASDGLSFETIKARAEAVWRDHLGSVQVKGGTETQRRRFATALYDFGLAPVDFTDEVPGWPAGEPSYGDIYCLWDTFRCAGSLMTLIHPERQSALLRSLLTVYQTKGWLPDAWAYGQYAFPLQGGTNADVLFSDAVVKGLGGFDRKLAYEAVRKNATVPATENIFAPHGRLAPYFTKGYVPAISPWGRTPDGRENEWAHAVSGTLEYAYNDFAVATVADAVGEKADARRFRLRSEAIFDLLDPRTGFFWGKDEAGGWLPDFDPKRRGTGWLEIFDEGSAWQYRYSVPHDVQGLANRLGGLKALESSLDAYFEGGHHEPGNEPGFLTPWLYNYVGRPDKTADRIRAILEGSFRLTPDGYPGDEDNGAMSSWSLFAAMGFFPNAGQDFYLIGVPVFSEVRLRLSKGRSFTIQARELSARNRYVQSAILDGKPWSKAWFRHGDIAKGATLILRMGPHPSSWGTTNPPPSLSRPTKGEKP